MEIWQVEVGGQVYDATFEELPDWIAEGSLLPDDKVRKGNLRWVEAKRVPALIPFFNATGPATARPVVTTTAASLDSDQGSFLHVPRTESVTPLKQSPASGMCHKHSDADASFVCTGCEKLFCRACPNSYGSSVRVCPECGQLCRKLDEHNSSAAEMNRIRSGVDEGFGFADFACAFRHPLRFRSSLIMGGALFAFLSLGQSASALGGIFMSVAALFCLMSANALTFGILSNIVDKFSQGQFDEDFLPEFDDFSIWESIVQPFFLSIAAYLVSFGPFILTMLIALYLVMSSITAHNEAIMSDLEKIPGTDYYAGRQVVEQSDDVKRVLGDIADKKAAEIESMTRAAAGQEPEIIVDQDAKDQEELWEMAQQHRRSQLESTLGKSPETRQKEYAEIVSGFLGLAAPVFVIGVITFLWGAFFFPAASAVAGYTRSFAATINPTVAIDTIRRLGSDYVKIIAMGFVVVVIYGVISGVVALVLSPFDLPGMGNLPAIAVTAFIGFYLFAVFSCVLGYAFFKASDRLKLPK